MDPAEAFTASLFKWDPRGMMQAVAAPPPSSSAAFLPTAYAVPGGRLRAEHQHQMAPGTLEDLFQAYGIRFFTAAKIAELGFTVNTLVDMKDEELEEMMNSLSQIFRWELMVGERYGIKAAVRAERRRLLDEERRNHHQNHTHMAPGDTTANAVDALSQEGDI